MVEGFNLNMNTLNRDVLYHRIGGGLVSKGLNSFQSMQTFITKLVIFPLATVWLHWLNNLLANVDVCIVGRHSWTSL